MCEMGIVSLWIVMRDNLYCSSYPDESGVRVNSPNTVNFLGAEEY